MKLNRETLNKPGTWLAFAGIAVLAGFVTWGWRWHASRAESERPAAASPVERSQPTAAKSVATTSPLPAVGSKAIGADPAADKAARVKKILRDYAEIQAKMSADYAAAGASFPGGLNTFLQQIALLEREKRADLGKVMTARELEDYEIRETAAGQKMRAALDGTAATDEQRRAAFRAEQAFDDQFGFMYNVTPEALAAREVARQAAETQVRAALGDGLFVTWLQYDDPSYADTAAFARQLNLAGDAALALWEVRNKVTLDALDIAWRSPGWTDSIRADLLQRAKAQVTAIAPLAPPEVVEREVASWLARPRTAVVPARP